MNESTGRSAYHATDGAAYEVFLGRWTALTGRVRLPPRPGWSEGRSPERHADGGIIAMPCRADAGRMIQQAMQP